MSWIFALPRKLENFLSLSSPGLIFKPTDDTYTLKPFSDDETNTVDKANTVWSQRAIEAYLSGRSGSAVLGLPNPIASNQIVLGGYQAIWYRELIINAGATLTVYEEVVVL